MPSDVERNIGILKRVFFLCHMDNLEVINGMKILQINNSNIINFNDIDGRKKILHYIHFIKDNPHYITSVEMTLSNFINDDISVFDRIFIAITVMYIYHYIDNMRTIHFDDITFARQKKIFDNNFRKYCNNESKTKTTEPPYIINILMGAREVLYQEVDE